MRIPCPFCGPRDAREFTYLGDATLTRPEPGGDFVGYVYFRDNPMGEHREHWYHAAGCRSWLTITRDTKTHAVKGAVLAREERR
jgi:sarcosine oxidase subunit delta